MSDTRMPVAAHMLPALRAAAIYLIRQNAQTLHQVTDSSSADRWGSPEEWERLGTARADFERCLRALDDVQAADPAGAAVPIRTLAVIADEAANMATFGLDDGIAVRECIDTVQGLDQLAAQVALARELRVLADEACGATV